MAALPASLHLPTRCDDTMSDRALAELAREALRGVIDPELGLDVVSLGLVYALEVRDGEASVDLTMTSAACPLGDHLVREAEAMLRAVPGLVRSRARLVWDPPWTPDRMDLEARKLLGWT